ncbi:response regulator transcription factor [Anaerofustis stercorihominis]|uniref:response regulator transcription factor n=1 Tax=Anaerofustis stercorihominis TaxID=214853 RepID=UPI001105E940|nr:response regulator transcription factor [Anaerofustis stercorihominis]
MKILIVEDEDDLREVMTKKLQKYYTVDYCKDGREAIDYISVYSYDIILLDVMIPEIDGFEVLKYIRASDLDTSVIMITAKDKIKDKVKGLDYGADDYLTKPFSFDELLARLRVLLRRSTNQKNNIIHAGDLTIDTRNRIVKCCGIIMDLTAKEYMLLEYFVYHKNIILTREQLEQQAWDNRFEGGSNIVDVYIRYLRKKIYDICGNKMIKTVRGMGYKLEVDEQDQNDKK